MCKKKRASDECCGGCGWWGCMALLFFIS